ncbi:MaoC family dehydratase N-terminal domain-containing protein [Pseudoalteromonas luteoviolacea]|uniref:MaoC/PaaZ C-terminal domain-containing protein n=1 Tax=Pseudoalteromonas luteoviolacea TaxID=43657 RepID=UPI001B37A7DA|nr:MaoC/PaaZ C-terminal domain-containing protein [Pseudoalteromonas luteoviolacea]MBQ4811443.1 MaoC family dehydratase N-terminal domain-containing protein [Pseudoalteromonas luteoviolacea]
MKLENIIFDEIEIGQNVSVVRTVTMNDVLGFAALTGDFNPVHVNEEYANQTRFHGVVAHGMWTAAQISAVIGTTLPGPGSIYLSQDLKFVAPVKIGDEITTKITVIDKDLSRRVVTLDCQCTNQKKQEVVFGIATILAPKEKQLVEVSGPSVTVCENTG